jgi:hypothetical protein
MFLMTNGQVLVQDQGPKNGGSSNWWFLTPDAKGSYVNGTWSSAASLQDGYGPVYFGSGVLPDGKFIIEGGAHNLGDLKSTDAFTNQGALYDPVANTWTPIQPPHNGANPWNHIGDATSVVLANGTFMMGAAGSWTAAQALFDESTLSWKDTGTNKVFGNGESGFTLLPDGKVLNVETGLSPSGAKEIQTNTAAVYDPSTGSWSSAGTTPQPLDDPQAEIGPQILMPKGMVFAEGANQFTAVYDTKTGKWSAGPDFPVIDGKQMTGTDACSAILPNGNVLFNGSPVTLDSNGNPQELPPTHWFIFDGTNTTQTSDDIATDSAREQSNNCNALVLPTGQILVDDRLGSRSIEVFNPSGVSNPSWLPVITSVESSLAPGTKYTVSGKQLNGLTQGSAFGDDLANATNYPLVQITNRATGNVTYARSFDFTSMSVTPNLESSASFVLPASVQSGASDLRVVASGSRSLPMQVTVLGGVAVTSSTPTPSSVPNATPKPKEQQPTKLTIRCAKGTSIKTIQGAHPNCPKGYKKK